MLRRIVAVDCKIAHIVVVDYSEDTVDIVVLAEMIEHLAEKYSHSE